MVGGSCGTEIAPVRCNFTHWLRLQRNQNTEVQKHTNVDRKCSSVFVLCSSLIPKINVDVYLQSPPGEFHLHVNIKEDSSSVLVASHSSRVFPSISELWRQTNGPFYHKISSVKATLLLFIGLFDHNVLM